MYELRCINLENNKIFTKLFYNVKAKDYFKNRCKYSKKIKILSIVKYY